MQIDCFRVSQKPTFFGLDLQIVVVFNVWLVSLKPEKAVRCLAWNLKTDFVNFVDLCILEMVANIVNFHESLIKTYSQV